MRLVLAALALAASVANGFYLPGVAPKEFKEGNAVELKVNKLTSPRTHLSYGHYSLPFCQPPGGVKDAAENLGEHLQGDLIENSAYELSALQDRMCQVLCAPRTLTADEVGLFTERITDEYSVNWIIDNLPAALVGITSDDKPMYSQGLPIGERDSASEDVIVFNHHRITVQYHTDPAEFEGIRIVGVQVYPMSIHQSIQESENGTVLRDCNRATGYAPDQQSHLMYVAGPSATQEVRLTFSYDVFWESSPVKWASRWDVYLTMGGRTNADVHWFSIVNSSIIVVFLTGLVAMIVIRAVRRDISRYNRVPTDEERAEDREETGWKLVHGDVFRTPSRWPVCFAVMTGMGAQVGFGALFLIIFAAVGFLSPANRGALMIALLLLVFLMGFPAGYAAARTHKLFSGTMWQRTTILTALAFPSIVFGVLFLLNLFVFAEGSTNAIPFLSMLAVLGLWLVVSVPLTFLGAFIGFRAAKIELPTRVRAMPRAIPPQPWYLSTPAVMLIGGVLPFGTIFVELFFLLTSIWLDQYYYVFGFLLLAFTLLVITCAEIAIVLVYFQLCAEDYRWWWRSWAIPGSSAIYLFVYSIFYFSTQLHIVGAVPTILYFGYMLLISFIFFLCTGVVGYLATFAFVHRIYGAVKLD